MRTCTHDHDCECVELDGKTKPLTWVCPILAKKMTRHWTGLCRTRQDYFEHWRDGPKQVARSISRKTELPPVRTQVASFLTAWAQLAGDGFRVVDADEFDRRIGICMGCSRFSGRTGRCRVCGCYGKIKARGRVWKCPIGKW